jgi:hypothetical protein
MNSASLATAINTAMHVAETFNVIETQMLGAAALAA